MSSNNSFINPIARVLLSIVFIIAGYEKLSALNGTTQYFVNLGLPMPYLLAIATGLFELIAGAAILIGFKTRFFAIMLAFFIVGTIIAAHINPLDQISVLKNLSIIGGLLLLYLHGAGVFSIDGKDRRYR